jgi:hypothetical protein
VLPENPPPSNGAADGPAPSEPAQFVARTACEGSTGLIPGVVISVEPSGVPAGRVDLVDSGDVAPMPIAGDWLGNVACANTAAFDSDAIPTVNDAYTSAGAIVRRFAGPVSQVRDSGSRICIAPAG